MGPGPVGWGMPILRATSTLVRTCLNEGLGGPGVANTTPYLRGQLRESVLASWPKPNVSPLCDNWVGSVRLVLASVIWLIAIVAISARKPSTGAVKSYLRPLEALEVQALVDTGVGARSDVVR